VSLAKGGSMETDAIQLDREDVVLLILEASERILGREWFSGITRLEKLLYLLECETDFEGIGNFFHFEAHNFGPFSKEVYEAIEFLLSCELIEVHEKAFTSVYSSSDEAKLLAETSDDDVSDEYGTESEVTEKQFKLTPNGRKVAGIMRDAIKRRRPSDVEAIDEIVRKYGTRPLTQLIRYVYRQYPAMTVKSVHPEARNIHYTSH
jgi:uncharacterized protein